MDSAVQRGFSLPAASWPVSLWAGKGLPGDGQMSGVFCLKNVGLQMLACREEKPRCLCEGEAVLLWCWGLAQGGCQIQAGQPHVGAGFASDIRNFQGAGWKNTPVLGPASGWES